MGQSWGILCSERVFCALEVEVEGEDQCAREKKSWNPTRTMRLIIFSQPSVFIRGHLHAQLEHGWWHRAIAILHHSRHAN